MWGGIRTVICFGCFNETEYDLRASFSEDWELRIGGSFFLFFFKSKMLETSHFKGVFTTFLAQQLLHLWQMC